MRGGPQATSQDSKERLIVLPLVFCLRTLRASEAVLFIMKLEIIYFTEFLKYNCRGGGKAIFLECQMRWEK